MSKQLREFVKPAGMEMMKDQSKFDYERIVETLGGEEVEVIYRKPNRDANEYVDRDISGWGYYAPLNQRTYEEMGVVVMQDVAIPLRDGTSEGHLHAWGTQDGKDGYDTIEWIAAQDWCSGKVGLSGNSAVAMCQWFIAAERPPHLACIAPWEGSNDIYRQFANKGGAPMVGFNEFVFRDVTGERVEDHMLMLKEHPLMDTYWEDKVAQLEKIRIPCYMTAGWSHQLHITGAFNAWQRIRSPKKWIRMHREFE